MKKTFVVLAALLSLSPAFSEIKTVPSQNTSPRQHLEVQAGCMPSFHKNNSRGFFALEHRLDLEPFFGFTAVQADGEVFDLVLRTGWKPFVFPVKRGEWKLGFDFAYHFQKDIKYFNKYNFILEGTVNFKSTKGFFFNARLGYNRNLTTFSSIEDFVLQNGNITIAAELGRIWKCGFELYGTLSSYTKFRDPNFFCPQLGTGIAWNFQKPLRLALEFEWGLTDFLSSVMYTNYMLLDFSMRFLF